MKRIVLGFLCGAALLLGPCVQHAQANPFPQGRGLEVVLTQVNGMELWFFGLVPTNEEGSFILAHGGGNIWSFNCGPGSRPLVYTSRPHTKQWPNGTVEAFMFTSGENVTISYSCTRVK
jgi:hypothetical protein